MAEPSSGRPAYEIVGHTADVGVRMSAPSLDGLLAAAAQGLFALLVENPESIEPLQQLELEVEGDDAVYLLFDWLNELLYLFERRHLLLRRFEVRSGPRGLSATVSGEAFDPARHRLDHEVKAITYHQLEAKQLEDGTWVGAYIVDI